MSFVNVFQYVLISYSASLICRRSSVVEHSLGKNILLASINKNKLVYVFLCQNFFYLLTGPKTLISRKGGL